MSSKTVAKKIVSVKKSLADNKTVAAKLAKKASTRGASKKVAPAKKLDTLELFVQTYARF